MKKKWNTYKRTKGEKNAMYSNEDWFFSEGTNALSNYALTQVSVNMIMDVPTIRQGLQEFKTRARAQIDVLVTAIAEAEVMLATQLPDEVTNDKED